MADGSVTAALSVQGLSQSYGGVHALSDVSFDVAPGERLGIIGPNGAGKTTLFNSIIGQPRPTGGRVLFGGQDITELPTHARAQLGLARSFQSVSLLKQLTVEENALIAVGGSRGSRYRSLRRLVSYAPVVEEAHALLERAGLGERKHARLAELSYGEQRRLDLILTLAGEPSVFLLDEPSAGLTSEESREIASIEQSLPSSVAVVIIDHDMDVIFTIAQRVLVLNRGQLVAEGTPAEIREDPAVRDVYLGGGTPVA
jgi:branched-chain amino acid transport system ATP-binding protein